MDKVQEILLNHNTDIRMEDSYVAPFSIYINCRCHRLALCFKHLFDQFPWLELIDRLLFGLWKGFYCSGKNRHVLKSIQEAYGSKALNLVKAAVTRRLPHGAACKRCWERYHFIIEALGDIITTSSNLELVACRDTLLEATVYQITFLEDAVSVTNILSLLLQSVKKDFSAISRSTNAVLVTFKVMGENRETKYLKNFNKIENSQKQNNVIFNNSQTSITRS